MGWLWYILMFCVLVLSNVMDVYAGVCKVLLKNKVLFRRQRLEVALTFSEALSSGSSDTMKEISRVLTEFNCKGTAFVLMEDPATATATATATPEAELEPRVPIDKTQFPNLSWESSSAATSELQLQQDINRCDAHVSRITRFFRPQQVWMTPDMVETVSTTMKKQIVIGDVYPVVDRFWKGFWVLTWAFVQMKVRDGSVIVLHDRPWTPELLKWLLPSLKARGFQCLSLVDVLDLPVGPRVSKVPKKTGHCKKEQGRKKKESVGGDEKEHKSPGADNTPDAVAVALEHKNKTTKKKMKSNSPPLKKLV
jgi:peptidoglycan/xylan/chitin deacetylase (PgdA/CDA1 family)